MRVPATTAPGPVHNPGESLVLAWPTAPTKTDVGPETWGRTAAYRIPDELNSSVIGEVKNVARQGYTRQLRDFVSYAESNSLTFNLYVRESTTFTTPLQNMIDSGVITRVPNLGP